MLGRLFSFQTEGGMCLGKIMTLGLVYSLPSAFLGSKAALALHWIKKPPRARCRGRFWGLKCSGGEQGKRKKSYATQGWPYLRHSRERVAAL